MITFRSHISEPECLNKFLSLFFASEMFIKAQQYSYNIEKDGELEAHFHIFITPEEVALYRDTEKVRKQLTTKEFKPFIQGLKDMKTDMKHALHILLVGKNKKRNDEMYYIGYVNKDPGHNRLNLPDRYIIRSIKYQTDMEMLKASIPTTDIRILSSKDVHITLLDYCKKNDAEPDDHLIYEKMASDGLMTAFISQSQKEAVIKECELYRNDKKFDDYINVEQQRKEREIKQSNKINWYSS